MSFEVFIKCDLESCNSRAQIPQVGNLPKGWIGLNYPNIRLDINGKNPLAQNRENLVLETKVFCGWACTHKFIKGFVREKAIENG